MGCQGGRQVRGDVKVGAGLAQLGQLVVDQRDQVDVVTGVGLVGVEAGQQQQPRRQPAHAGSLVVQNRHQPVLLLGG